MVFLGHSSDHQRPSSGLLHQKLRPTSPRKCSIRRSPLPYPRGMEGKEALQDPRAINPASTVISWAIGPKSAPILRRTIIRTREIRGRQILRHIQDTCTTLLLKRFPRERLSLLVCFLSNNILLLFYLIRELLIHL